MADEWIKLESLSKQCVEVRSKQITGAIAGGPGIYLTLKANQSTNQAMIIQRYYFVNKKSGKLSGGRPSIAYGLDQAERVARDILTLIEMARGQGLKEVL